jgi:predicted nucleotidyltransferase
VNQVTNNNENRIDVDISFNSVREKVKGMSALPEAEINEILRKIDEIENIVHSSDRKAKKWENAKNIIKWIADKGVDVGITLLPLLLQIK